MKVTDYTVMPLGTSVDDGEIQICTHCGKPGLAENASGKMFFTHSQKVGFDQKGNPVIDWKMCPSTAPTTS
ncbi:hypothetical protein [Tunturiibacter gelidiferens]|uniref:hypothetical protein n=1 Tax=Tunturiibacter gelidiferens TaxID=3069689 RepID=UPI003D9B199C